MPILNPEHLLDQAERLIASPRAGPARQADIRRAISSAYYSVFHAVLTAAADSVAGRVHRGSAAHTLVYRSIEHRTLRSVCELARRSVLPPAYREHTPTSGFDRLITGFAKNVLSLQDLRHAADYDPRPRFLTTDAVTAIELARATLRQWQAAPADQRRALLWLMLFRSR